MFSFTPLLVDRKPRIAEFTSAARASLELRPASRGPAHRTVWRHKGGSFSTPLYFGDLFNPEAFGLLGDPSTLKAFVATKPDLLVGSYGINDLTISALCAAIKLLTVADRPAPYVVVEQELPSGKTTVGKPLLLAISMLVAQDYEIEWRCETHGSGRQFMYVVALHRRAAFGVFFPGQMPIPEGMLFSSGVLSRAIGGRASATYEQVGLFEEPHQVATSGKPTPSFKAVGFLAGTRGLTSDLEPTSPARPDAPDGTLSTVLEELLGSVAAAEAMRKRRC